MGSQSQAILRFCAAFSVRLRAAASKDVGEGMRCVTARPCRRLMGSAACAAVLTLVPILASAQSRFAIEEASMADIQRAIKSGQTTCQMVVQSYINRAKAYNGTCTALVTADGLPIPPATGAVRAGSRLTFPTNTISVSTVFPNFQEYVGLPFEFGRMGIDHLRAERAATIRYACRHSKCRATERA